jgi:hypothetical protein
MLKNSTLSVEIFYTYYQGFWVFRVIFGKLNGVELPRHLTKEWSLRHETRKLKCGCADPDS